MKRLTRPILLCLLALSAAACAPADKGETCKDAPLVIPALF